jgi:hypothetical protein
MKPHSSRVGAGGGSAANKASMDIAVRIVAVFLMVVPFAVMLWKLRVMTAVYQKERDWAISQKH